MKSKLKKYIANGILLTAVSFLLRGLAVSFNVYITQKIGAEGLGLYTLLGSVYSFALTLALSGINLTTTRLVSDALGENNYAKLRSSMKACIGYSLFFGALSAILLLTFAEPLAIHALKDSRTITPLRLCASTLPLIALTSCFNGYFTAVRRVYKNAIAQVFEQLARIALCSILLTYFFGRDIQSSCIALVLGGALAEMLSFSLSLLFYVFEKEKRIKRENFYTEQGKINKKMLSIALPLAFSTYFRSALLTLEHILIPIGIEKSGSNRAEALIAYGTLQSMVIPLVLFPAALIYSFSGLLIPELAELKVQNNKREIKYISSRAIHLALIFAIGTAGVMIFFANELGQALYSSDEAGKYIKLMAHIVPIMYLDSTVDAMLKGLGQQLYTMNVNIIDTLCSVVLVLILIPKMGAYGYITLIMTSEIFNASLSIFKLVKITGLKIKLGKWFFRPALSIILSTIIVKIVMQYANFGLIFNILLTILIYLGLVCLTRVLNREEIRWICSFFCTERKKRLEN